MARARRRLVASWAVVVTTALAATACGADTESTTGSTTVAATTTPTGSTAPPTSASGSDTATAAPSGVPTLDPALAVDPPGPRRGAVVSADILIQDTEPLSDDVVRAVRDLPGVRVADRISVSQVLLENKLYTVAAVDAGDYRRFTDVNSAEKQELWDRVAAGEVAVDDTLRDKLPVDRDDFVELGLGTDTLDLHVGAWAPQVEGIDLVVNDKVGAALGMRPGNALVVSTGSTSPQSLRQPIGQIIGSQISLQNLDVVTRLGLDPDAFQTAVFFGSFADAVGVFHYTPTTGGRIAPDPAWVASHITTEVVPILGSVTCNKAIMPQLKAALAEVVQQGLTSSIHPGEYAGCYYPRYIAGTTTLSNHSFGLALDLNVPGNQRGTVGEMDRRVVAIFKYWGFAWGGDWRYTDPMHFELQELRRPG